VTPTAHEIVVGPLEGAVVLRRLNETTAAAAASAPGKFRAGGERHEASGDLVLLLEPYGVVRVDPAT
jgi:hypothetical protein